MYKENFPDLFPKQTWGQYFKSAITSRIWTPKDSEISDDTLIIEKKSFLVNFYFYFILYFYEFYLILLIKLFILSIKLFFYSIDFNNSI